MLDQPNASGARAPEQLDNGELRMLLLAVKEADARVEAERDRVAKECAKLVGTAARANRAIRSLLTFERTGELQEAVGAQRDVALEHADEGAADRRNRLLPSWLAWLCVIAAAAFDAWFFATVFQQVADVETQSLATVMWNLVTGKFLSDPTAREGFVTLLPGLVLAFGLVLAGSWVAEPVVRWKFQAEEGTRKAGLPRPVKRLAVVALPLVAVMIWISASLRQQNVATPGKPYGTLPIGLLIATLTLVAIGAKVAAYNPFADRADRVRRRRRRAGLTRRYLARKADRAMIQHERAWDALRLTVSTLAGEAHQRMIDAWAWPILPRRMLDADANLQPPAPPQQVGTWARQDGLPDLEALFVLFENVRQPKPNLGPLWHASGILQRHDPASFRRRLYEVEEQLDGQLTDSKASSDGMGGKHARDG